MGKKQKRADAWNSMREQRRSSFQGNTPNSNVLIIDPEEQKRAKLQRKIEKRLEEARNRKPSKEKLRKLKQLQKKKEETRIMNECFEALNKTQLTNKEMATLLTTGHVCCFGYYVNATKWDIEYPCTIVVFLRVSANANLFLLCFDCGFCVFLERVKA